MASAIVFLGQSLSTDGGWLVLLAAAGLIAGLYFFFSGFRMLRLKRMILNTPLSRIHSASIGLVEVTGTPVGPSVLSASVTGDPCYYYRVQAWQWVESGDKHEWKSVLDESLYVPFFLEDGTGRVLVDAKGANMDVHRSFSDEVGASFFRNPQLMPPNVRDFLVHRGLVPYEKIKLEEHTIPRDFPLFVFGTFGENPTLGSWSPRPQSGGSTIGTLKFRYDGGANLGFSVRRPTTLPDGQGQAAPSSDKSSSGDFDLHPSVAISRGERKEPFTISWHSQKEVVGKLAWKSAAFIWGGPALTLACLYFLMTYFQWIL